MSAKLYSVHIELDRANALIGMWVEEFEAPKGFRFAIACVDVDGEPRGAAIVGRPIARYGGSPEEVLEVTRIGTDGSSPNIATFLYGHVAKAGEALGYRRIQTYQRLDASTVSLRGAHWLDEGEWGGGQWHHNDGHQRSTDRDTSRRRRWGRALTPKPELAVRWPDVVAARITPLFDPPTGTDD